MTKRTLWPMALCLGLYLAVGLVAARTHPSYFHHFLLWNVFLAALPLLFALLFQRFRKLPLRVLLGLLWLAFFPNAPYLLTDLIHMTRMAFFSSARLTRDLYAWLVLMQLALGVLLGHLMGLYSLWIFHQEAQKGPFRRAWAWVLVLAVCLASGYAVYIGRFARVNSWDFLRLPLLLSRMARVTDLHGLALSLCFAGYVLATYLMFLAFQGGAAPALKEAEE